MAVQNVELDADAFAPPWAGQIRRTRRIQRCRIGRDQKANGRWLAGPGRIRKERLDLSHRQACISRLRCDEGNSGQLERPEGALVDGVGQLAAERMTGVLFENQEKPIRERQQTGHKAGHIRPVSGHRRR
jgi:hypothetical protein